MPRWAGLRSENAAHRIAVEWDGAGGVRTGVYIPRRDTDALATALLGGRIYPGEQHRARFSVLESQVDLSVTYASSEGSTSVAVEVAIADELVGSALLADLAAASLFFRQGAIGFSATRDGCRVDGMEPETAAWSIEAGVVRLAQSSFFDDPAVFPPGLAQLDCAGDAGRSGHLEGAAVAALRSCSLIRGIAVHPARVTVGEHAPSTRG